MTKKQAISTLKRYNRWRRGAEIPQPCPTMIGLAIEKVLEVLEE